MKPPTALSEAVLATGIELFSRWRRYVQEPRPDSPEEQLVARHASLANDKDSTDGWGSLRECARQYLEESLKRDKETEMPIIRTGDVRYSADRGQRVLVRKVDDKQLFAEVEYPPSTAPNRIAVLDLVKHFPHTSGVESPLQQALAAGLGPPKASDAAVAKAMDRAAVDHADLLKDLAKGPAK